MYKNDLVLKIVCTNKTNEELILKFLLLKNHLVDRWIELVKKSNEMNKKLVVNYRKILNKQELEDEFAKFISCITTINQNYDTLLPIPQNLESIFSTQNILNDLHAEFERYGQRLVSKEIKHLRNSILHENMLRLNDRIHNFESIAKNQNFDKFCGALVDWLPAGLHEKLLPVDYLLFSQDIYWGYIYLGYNTLGKNWQNICIDNDIGVLQRDSVKPQQRFAAEFSLEFHIKGDPFIMQNRFYNWYKQLDHSLKNASLNYEQMALGMIPLARLWYYEYGPNKMYLQDFSNINKSFQRDWNANVWSKFDTIKTVTFENR